MPMKKHNKVVMLARNKLSSMESKISEVLINNELVMKTLWQLLMKKKKYRELKGSTRMMNSQGSDVEKIKLIEEGKKIGINEVIKRNKIINNSLKQ